MWGQADRQEVGMNAKIAVVGCMAILVGCMSLEERLASNDPEVRLGAEKELTAQACYAADVTQAMAVADKITDEDCLCQLVLYAKRKEVRESAKSKLKAEKSFAILAAASANEAEAVEAFGKIKDQKLILQVSQAAKSPKIKQLAAQSITDSEVLFRLAMAEIWKFMTSCTKSPTSSGIYYGNENEDVFVKHALVVQEYLAKIKDEKVLKQLLSIIEEENSEIVLDGVVVKAADAFGAPNIFAEDFMRDKESGLGLFKGRGRTAKFRGKERDAEIARIVGEINKQAKTRKNRWSVEARWVCSDTFVLAKYATAKLTKRSDGTWTDGVNNRSPEELMVHADKMVAKGLGTFVAWFRDILFANFIEVSNDDQTLAKMITGRYDGSGTCCHSFAFDEDAMIADGVRLSKWNTRNDELYMKAARKIKDQTVLASILLNERVDEEYIKPCFSILMSNVQDDDIKRQVILETDWPPHCSEECVTVVRGMKKQDAIYAIAEASRAFYVKKAAFETLKDQELLLKLVERPGRNVPALPNDRSVLFEADFRGELQKGQNAHRYFSEFAVSRITDVEGLKKLQPKVNSSLSAVIAKRIRKIGGVDDKADMERITAAAKESKMFTLKGFYIGMPISDARILAEHYFPDSNVVVTRDNKIEMDVVHKSRFDRIPMYFCEADKEGSVYRFNFTKKQLGQWFKYETHTYEKWINTFAGEQNLNFTPISVADQWTIEGVVGAQKQEAYEFKDKEREYRVVYFGKTEEATNADIDRLMRNQYRGGKVAGYLNTWFGGWLNAKGAEEGTLRVEQIRD